MTGTAATFGTFTLPPPQNEPMKSYAPGSPERQALQAALAEAKKQVHHVPLVVNGKRLSGLDKGSQAICANHASLLCSFERATPDIVQEAIDGALAAKKSWEAMPFASRAAIFLKAADLLSNKYRYEVMAATMLGQGKNAWQAEIDAAAELADFWRFNCHFAQQIYAEQPLAHAPGTWNRQEYRPLEGFVYAISPFNFTAIGGNLPSAPALMGNVVLWKPSDSAIYSNYLVFKILEEAGLPPGVIQFIPGPAAEITEKILSHPMMAGVHFTGSTQVFQSIWSRVGENIRNYRSYPRLVGETGGKNFHLIHPSADLISAVHNTIRSAFEYQGQKCSACSRLFVPSSMWPSFKELLVSQIKTIKMGDEFECFCGPVINRAAFEKISSYIEYAKSNPDKAQIICGGKADGSRGFFIEPTVIETTDFDFKTLKEEIFGPVLTVYVFPDEQFEEITEKLADSSSYALTGSVFSQDREVIVKISEILRHAAGNFYINDKSSGAVVGQQAFGGGRQSGTNDKAGSVLNLIRWVSPRTIKETFLPLGHYTYPSNQS